MKNILIKIALLLPVFVLLNCSGGDSAIDPVFDLTYICLDADGDGFTVEDEVSGTIACSAVDDCNDGDVDIFPGAIEYVDDGIDQNCDGEDGDNDTDDDGVLDVSDNCPDEANADQLDADVDGTGNACDSDYVDPDFDDDGFEDDVDVCPYVSDDQTNVDGDECGAACDDDDQNAAVCSDSDGDGVDADEDNCDSVANADQYDTDQDGDGNECDTDDDGDGVSDDDDNCPFTDNPTQGDDDVDGLGNNCEADADGDGVGDDFDNCDEVTNVGQEDTDGDGIADACDVEDCTDDIGTDEDLNGVANEDDDECADYFVDTDSDGLYDRIDPQTEIKNIWGYIDQDEGDYDVCDCVDEGEHVDGDGDPAYTYTYVAGTNHECSEGDATCDSDIPVSLSGVNELITPEAARWPAHRTYACAGGSAESDIDYGVYIIITDNDGDGLGNMLDPNPETANAWWLISPEATETHTFTSSFLYTYTFMDFDGEDEIWYDFQDWEQSAGTITGDSIGESSSAQGIYVRQSRFTVSPSRMFP